jgi:hypothetical protein
MGDLTASVAVMTTGYVLLLAGAWLVIDGWRRWR